MTDHPQRYPKIDDHPYRKTILRRNIEKDNEERKYRQSVVNILKARTKYELMYEAFYVANMFYYMNESDKYARDTVFYIISTSWFNRWKRYVNFDYFMSNTDKFLQINTLPINDKAKGSFIQSLDAKVRSELDKFFDSFFLSNNGENYPGVVSNKDLLYDKATYYVNFDKPKSSLNYNLIDSLENGNDYFIISADIWKFFKAVYGGKEVKRYRVSTQSQAQVKDDSTVALSSSSSSKENGKANELLIESKLKVIDLIIVKPASGKSFKLERPKFIFISYRASLYNLKKHLAEMFAFLKGIDRKDIRLWMLDPKFTFDSFESYVNEKRKEDPRVLFPGFSLNLFEDHVELGDIDDMLVNKLIVLEYIDHQQSHFLFKSQYLNDFNKEFQADIKLVSRGKKKMASNPNAVYDRISFTSNSARGDKSNLFAIKRFFKEKYQLSYLNELESNVILKGIIESDSTSNVEFFKEVELLRNHMDQIFDKNELLIKFSVAYSNAMDGGDSAGSNFRNKSAQVLKTRSKQDLIMKKRERAKIISHLNKSDWNKPSKEEPRPFEDTHLTNDLPKDKDEDQPSPQSNIDNNLPILENDLFDEGKDKCSYCSKAIEGEVTKCGQCDKVKYCTSICLHKDLRFHNKTCLINP